MNSTELDEIEEYRYAKSQESKAIPFDQAFQEIDSWQMDIVMERMADYKNNPNQALDFDQSMDEIESELS